MNVRNALAESDLWGIVRVMQAVLVIIVLFGLVSLRISLIINAGVALAITFLPALLRRNYRVPMNAGLTLWITVAVFLHAIGALGAYEIFGWYDSLTHALSASIVAGAGYASIQALDIHSEEVSIPPQFMVVLLFVFVFAFGVLWEILEFTLGGLATILGTEPVLAQYGVADIVTDLVFNAVGGGFVAILGSSRLGDFARTVADRLDTYA
jgi:hypothetical protein